MRLKKVAFTWSLNHKSTHRIKMNAGDRKREKVKTSLVVKSTKITM